MRLLDVYETQGAAHVLYRLLEEREPGQNISHRVMPSFQHHLAFMAKRPYDAWYIAEARGQIVGAGYITDRGEIGIGVLKEHRGKGHGKAIVQAVMKQNPRRRFLANINPANKASIRLFEGLGFGHIQNTHERNTDV